MVLQLTGEVHVRNWWSFVSHSSSLSPMLLCYYVVKAMSLRLCCYVYVTMSPPYGFAINTLELVFGFGSGSHVSTLIPNSNMTANAIAIDMPPKMSIKLFIRTATYIYDSLFFIIT